MTYTLPTQIRSSFVSSLSDSCESQWVEFLYPERKFEALHFLLGTGVHSAIEYAITSHCQNIDEALEFGFFEVEEIVNKAGGWDNVFTTLSNRATRTLDTYRDNMRECVDGWMQRVPPWGQHRDPIYEEFDWPPQTEVVIDIPGIRTTVDAIFRQKYGEKFYIVDWKSSSSKNARPIQIQFYAFALRMRDWLAGSDDLWEFGNMDEATSDIGHFEYVALAGRSSAGSYWGDGQMAKWWERAYTRLDSIKYTGPVLQASWQCNWCKVRPVCPIYGSNWTDFAKRSDQLQRKDDIDAYSMSLYMALAGFASTMLPSVREKIQTADTRRKES